MVRCGTVITVPADTLAPVGARPSAGKVLTIKLGMFFFLIRHCFGIFPRNDDAIIRLVCFCWESSIYRMIIGTCLSVINVVLLSLLVFAEYFSPNMKIFQYHTRLWETIVCGFDVLMIGMVSAQRYMICFTEYAHCVIVLDSAVVKSSVITEFTWLSYPYPPRLFWLQWLHWSNRAIAPVPAK